MASPNLTEDASPNERCCSVKEKAQRVVPQKQDMVEAVVIVGDNSEDSGTIGDKGGSYLSSSLPPPSSHQHSFLHL